MNRGPEIKSKGTNLCSVHMEDLMPIIEERLSAGHSVSFSPKGVSMLPMLKEGRDSVTLSPVGDVLKKYDLIFYRRDNNAYVLHRIVAVDKDYTCIGDNQYKKEYGIRRDQIIGVVTSFERCSKEYSVDSFSYKMYCRMWSHTRFARRCIRALARRIKRLFKNK